MSYIIVIEPFADGHRFHYIRHFSKELIKLGYKVALFTYSEAKQHPTYGKLCDECKDSLVTITFDAEDVWKQKIEKASRVQRQMCYRTMFGEAVQKFSKNNKVVVVFLPYSDYCQDAISIFGSPFGTLPWAGLTMRPYFQYKPMGIVAPTGKLDKIEEWAFYQRLLKNRYLHKLFTIDQPLFEYSKNTYPKESERLVYVNEPVEFKGAVTREQARKALNIPEDKIIILSYGLLDYRKGVDCLLNAFENPGIPENIGVLFAGPQVDTVTELLKTTVAQEMRKRGQLFEQNKYMLGDDEYQAFIASDIVWMGYRQKYTMSAVIIQAGILSLPVIACHEGVVAWLANRYSLGPVVDVSKPDEVRRTIIDLANNSETREKFSQSGAVMTESYSAAKFAQIISNELINGLSA